MSAEPLEDGTRILPRKSVFQTYIEGQSFPIDIVATDIRAEIRNRRSDSEKVSSKAVILIEMVSYSINPENGVLTRDRELADILTILSCVDEEKDVLAQERKRELFVTLRRRIVETAEINTLDREIACNLLNSGSSPKSIAEILLQEYTSQEIVNRHIIPKNIEDYPRIEALDRHVKALKDKLPRKPENEYFDIPARALTLLYTLSPLREVPLFEGVIERSKDFNNLLFCLSYAVRALILKEIDEENFFKQFDQIAKFEEFLSSKPSNSIDEIVYKAVLNQLNRIFLQVALTRNMNDYSAINDAIRHHFDLVTNVWPAVRERNPFGTNRMRITKFALQTMEQVDSINL